MTRQYDRCGASCGIWPAGNGPSRFTRSGRKAVPLRGIALAVALLASGFSVSSAVADQGAAPSPGMEQRGAVAPPDRTGPAPDDLDMRQDPSGTDQDGGSAARPQPDFGGCPYRGRRLELIV